MHPEELERLMRTVREHTKLSSKDLGLAEDILDNLGANRLILSNRTADLSGIVERLRVHYENERNRQLEIMDQILSTRRLPKFRDDQLQETYEELKSFEFVKGKLQIKDHNNNELYVKSLANVRGRKVDLFCLIGWDSLHDDLYELKLIGDMLIRAGVDTIDLYMPFIPYQREDKKDEGRVPISAKQIFNDVGNSFKSKLNRLVTFELHSPQAQGYIDAPVDALNCNNLFANYVLSDYFQQKYAGKEFVVVSPDVGHAKLAAKFAKLLGVDYVIIDKAAHTEHGETKVHDRNIEDAVRGRICLMIDDMCDTGGSLITAYTNIMSYGAAGVVAMVGHGIFSPKKSDGISAEKKLRECGIKVVTTDTIPRTQEYYAQNSDWLDVLSITKKLAKVMIANRIDSSVGAVIDRNKADIEQAVQKKERMYIDDVLIKK